MEPLLQKYIKCISNNYSAFMPRDHYNYLLSLKRTGFEPDVIYDIGAGALGWTRNVETVWPHAKYIVFDAYQSLQYLYQELEYDFHVGVLSNEDDKMMEYYQNDAYFLENSCLPFCGEKRPKTECLIRPGLTLDTVVERRDFPLPDLIYIHVNGMELEIIKGAIRLFSRDPPKRVIVNIYHDEVFQGSARWSEIVSYMKHVGYHCDSTDIGGEGGEKGEYGFVLFF